MQLLRLPISSQHYIYLSYFVSKRLQIVNFYIDRYHQQHGLIAIRLLPGSVTSGPRVVVDTHGVVVEVVCVVPLNVAVKYIEHIVLKYSAVQYDESE